MQNETSSPIQPDDSRVSRRLFIKAGVAAGGAAWAAPAIESFTSSAAAGSVPTQGTPNFGCSWVYIVWAQVDDSTFYYTGWQGSGTSDGITTCNKQAAYPQSKSAVTTTCQEITYELVPSQGVPPTITVTPPGSSAVNAKYVNGCANFSYSADGKTVFAVSNVAILAVFTHGGGSGSNAVAHCPTGLFGNSIRVSCAS